EAEAIRDAAGDNADQSPLVQAAEQKAQEAAQQAQAVAGDLSEDDTSDKIVAALRAAAEQASEEIQGIRTAMGGLGAGDQRGVLSRVAGTPEAIREALRSDPELRRIAEIAGRMRISAKAKQRNKVRYVPEQIVDVTLGGDIARLLPSELMRFADPTMELDLLRRLSEESAMVYDLEGSEPEEKGPIVMAVDASSSMAGHPFEFAMGVALALLELALTQKRPFLFFTFDTSPNAVFEITRPGQLTLEMLHQMLQGQFSGGGTNIKAAVSTATDQMACGEFERADLVLVTDGYDDWGGTLDKFKEQAPGSSAYGVAIGTQFPEQAQRQLNGYAELSSQDVDGCQTAKVEVVFGV
ncbi:MAG TPA: VWA domain-containing protein, partial [Acidobacteriota bacterium]|nr:VWA domain-containing protein [Acidobacteriota bacterium]